MPYQLYSVLTLNGLAGPVNVTLFYALGALSYINICANPFIDNTNGHFIVIFRANK